VKTIGVGRNPQGLAITPEGASAWVINQKCGTGSVSVIDTTNNRVTRELPGLDNGQLAFGTFIRPPPTGPVKPFKTAVTALPGDLNGDGVVDCGDLAIVKAAFGSRRGASNYDPRADVNSDGIVDLREIAFVSQKVPVGTRCP
jgi:hypothetical protein